jgi:hypothetical protein
MKPVSANTDSTPQPLSAVLLIRKLRPKKPISVRSRPGCGNPRRIDRPATAALNASVRPSRA